MSHCTACEGYFKVGASYCMHCGKNLREISDFSMEGDYYCPSCPITKNDRYREKTFKNKVYCVRCGAKTYVIRSEVKYAA